jgi:hypothetical protein
MVKPRKSDSDRYLIFRIEEVAGLESRPVFLSEKNKWTSRRALAKKGSLSHMKDLVAKLKKSFPDLILEQYRQ